MLLISSFNFTLEHILCARKTRQDIRLVFCEMGQKDCQGIYWPTKVGFLYMDVFKDVGVR